MSDVVALLLFIAALHLVLFVYWKGMGAARRKKFEKLQSGKD